MIAFIIMSMIFCHIIADFNLQGIMGNLKQKSWWDKNYPFRKYKYDYLAVLVLHSFSWSFMIMLPIAVYLKFAIDWVFIVVLVANIIIHSVVDHLKANKLIINLIEDQLMHIIQILATVFILVR